MANISDKTNLTNHTGVVNEAGVAGANWISQINAGGTVYDIATHHGITFVEGNNGAKTVWNGLTDLEVIIPSITDIVQTPIEFAGTVGADGKITWVNGHSEAEAGSLVFITEIVHSMESLVKKVIWQSMMVLIGTQFLVNIRLISLVQQTIIIR
jgi:hypothetical protein